MKRGVVRLKNGNAPGNFSKAARCGAKTRRENGTRKKKLGRVPEF